MRLDDSFEVAAPVERVWQLLNDVPVVVPCMPGAELVEATGEDSWKAVVRVKLGPVALQFATDVVRETADEEAHRVVLATKARELRGRGGAQATLESTMTELGGTTRVDIVTDLSLQGAVAQYGRGIVPDIASRLTRQFAANLAALLEPEDPAAPAGQTPAEPNPGAPPAAPAAAEPVAGLRLGLRALWEGSGWSSSGSRERRSRRPARCRSHRPPWSSAVEAASAARIPASAGPSARGQFDPALAQAASGDLRFKVFPSASRTTGRSSNLLSGTERARSSGGSRGG